jgi:hypothetical protein
LKDLFVPSFNQWVFVRRKMFSWFVILGQTTIVNVGLSLQTKHIQHPSVLCSSSSTARGRRSCSSTNSCWIGRMKK